MSQLTLGEFSGSGGAESETEFVCEHCDWEFDDVESLETHLDACQNPKKKTYECAHCDTIFTDYISRRETRGRENFFCNRDCRDEFQKSGEWRSCATCDEDVWVPDSQLDSMGEYSIDNHFCDKECERDYKRKNWVGEDHPRWEGGDVDVSCGICETEFGVKPAKYASQDVFFCSPECTGVYQSSDPETRECAWCGTDVTRKPHEFKNENAYCTSECAYNSLSEQRRGSNNPAWKGGKRIIARVRATIGDESWNRTAKRVRANHDHLCQMCGEPSPSRRLSVHHIVPVASGGTNGDWNLIPLCQSCHKKADNYIEQFTDVHLFPSSE